MSKYTTGEIARLCGVSVRTVQYYDSRNILVPSELSEGGRRLYSEADLEKLKIICFLRSLELPIDSIRELFEQEQSEGAITLLLEEQEKRLRAELAQKQESVTRITEAKKTLRLLSQVSAESIGDIAHIMDRKKQLARLRHSMLILGLLMELIEILSIIIWVKTGFWQPFAIGISIEAAIGIWISYFYFTNVSYICPHCHGIFRPRFWDAFFARHTPYTRKLICVHCGYHGYSVETYGKEDSLC